MTSQITIALDAMGGDNAPDCVVEGAELALERHPEVHFLFFGDKERLGPLLDRHPRLKTRSEIHHTEDMVRADDLPSVALRQRRASSMRLAINAVGDGRAHGVVSAGNTGALMAMSKFVLKTLPNIDRPAMVTTLPTMRGNSVVLDLGANVHCDGDNLVQFAVMGAAFARIMLGLKTPTVGLLNIGEEEIKGNDALKNAAAILKDASLPMDFYGFIEGDDIARGTTDVVVTDGFTGNVALKVAEGTSGLFSQFLRDAFSSNIFSKIGYLMASRSIQGLRDRVDPRKHNGAVFIGLNGISVKSHGNMDGLGYSHAIDVAIDLIADDVTGKIIDDFRHFGGLDAGEADLAGD